MLNSIKNFIQLTPEFATSGQPTADEFTAIAAAGFRHVINLAMPDHPQALVHEGALVTSLGMNYIHIPVAFDQPRKDQLRMFCQVLQFIRHEKVFVHCIMNYRVSAFMFHYLTKVEHRSERAARSPMFEQWHPDEVWKELLSWSAEDIGLNQ
ncbi:protein tyrosine phosphatase family protein [Gynuella sunshinyii]|uniref:DSP-PTPase phosphatase fused to NAD+ Kinase domain-containing protein n=1 Tax=Gynuella sunshinyii YC6258 TaxID=1445510 RepID=A0A0C5VCA6_9GAMM|nr:protein tyrosine phosphatase family protein [Gynuella sunshinyii]AJQ92132.1 hypothetical protein YC6258_00076 [Gynuella sunshinyii YC6258]